MEQEVPARGRDALRIERAAAIGGISRSCGRQWEGHVSDVDERPSSGQANLRRLTGPVPHRTLDGRSAERQVRFSQKRRMRLQASVSTSSEVA
ncbi:hypothetical protein SAMN06295998_12229 [Primorskyibacter flagellatus]|uniref:Uncharacterized protein n=1 Tax=Primorskyibacter flagellatus TaxID=1387277 RepID=A0A1W2E6H4_9RHOB|nr:hypothetical protein SAMN06295998_12229 [Primorskyibacter flagellatus]